VARKPNFTQIDHHTVVRQPYLSRYHGRSRVMVDILCPRCGETRARGAAETRNEILRVNYRGFCRPCSFAAVQDGTHRWMIRSRKEERRGENSSGYRLVYPRSVSDEDLPMYRAMQNHGQPLLEHRWLMAIHLKRQIHSYECIDHRDGNKHNNNIDNLRIYIKGEQQEGSCPGYGTYYHEWQLAEARIRELENVSSPLDIIPPHSTVGA
jgi:hypothetical protein